MSDTMPVVLTATDYAVIETLMPRHGEQFPGAAELIRQKLRVARIVQIADLPRDVVTLRSRVCFRVGNSVPDERTLVAGPSEAGSSPHIVLNSAQGLALVGAAAGQTVRFMRADGSFVEIFIESVPFQPKFGRPELKIVARQEYRPPEPARPGRIGYVAARRDDDDPGPSAA